MTWATKQEAIRLAVARCLRLPDVLAADGSQTHVVEWFNRRTAHRWVDGPWADLELGAIVARGQDESRHVGEDPADGTQLMSYGGYRLLTVTVAINSFSQEPGEDAVAELASRLRTRLRRPDVLAILQAEDVALVAVEGTLAADYEDDGRIISASFTDLRLATVELDTDVAIGSGGDGGSGQYVSRASGTGEDDLTGSSFDAAAS